jgi:hypothetical protein
MQVNATPFAHYRKVFLKEKMLNRLLRAPQVDCRLLYIQQHRGFG